MKAGENIGFRVNMDKTEVRNDDKKNRKCIKYNFRQQ